MSSRHRFEIQPRAHGRSASGSATIALLIATVFIGLLMAGLLSILSQRFSSISRMNTVVGRKILESKLRRAVQMQADLYASISPLATENSALRNCLIDDSAFPGNPSQPNDCQATAPTSSWQGVSIYELTESVPPTRKISGESAAAGVLYDSRGEVCTETDPTACPFSVSSEFSSVCPGGTLACNMAAELTFRLTISPTAKFTNLKERVIEQKVAITDSITRPGQPPPTTTPVPTPDPNPTPNPVPVVVANANPSGPSGPAVTMPTPTPTPTPVPVTFSNCGAGKIAKSGGPDPCKGFKL